MVQSERGLESGCRCPECLNTCNDCMGTAQKPLTAEELRNSAELFLAMDREEGRERS
ncbi:MAG TPA: hypothetical protein VN512_12480 [Clostridia bacterium]|nr:hypothetical protein [Clostridia bacterium]